MSKKTINGFRIWQVEAFERFYLKPYCYLISPPGEGKSTSAKAHALTWTPQGKHVLIIAPRTLITSSFEDDHTFKWNAEGKVVAQDSKDRTFTYKQPKYKLSTWLLNEQVNSDYPLYVTTHQAAIRAIKKIKSENAQRLAYNNLVIIIDETHMLSSDNGGELGKILNETIENQVPTLIMTGTPFRGDDQPILSPELEKKFVIYNREFPQALDEMEYLQGFNTKILVGNTMPALKNILSSFKEENRYAVIKLPNVNTRHTRRLAREMGIDLDHNPDEKKIELKIKFDQKIKEICEELNLSHMSIVEEDSETLNDILKKARNETAENVAKYLPRVVVAQDKIGLGVDCPWWTDSIMLGASKSCTETVQFGMRSGRDHFSKENRNVTVWTLVPEYWEPEVTTEDAKEFAEDLIKTQLWWQFIGGGPQAPDIKTKQNLPPQTNKIPDSPKKLTEAALEQAKCVAFNNAYYQNSIPEAEISFTNSEGVVTQTITVGNHNSNKKIQGNGNKISPIKSPYLPEGILKTENYLIQLNHLVEVLVYKGDGKTFQTFLKKEQITPNLIIDLYQLKYSIGQIVAKTGWTPEKIEKILVKAGLIKKSKSNRTRIRGGKED